MLMARLSDDHSQGNDVTSMKARVSWVEGMMFTGESGSGQAIVMDGAPENGGRNVGIRPMELMLLGLAGCTAFDVVLILKRGRDPITDCVVEVEAERAPTDPRSLRQFTSHTASPDSAYRRKRWNVLFSHPRTSIAPHPSCSDRSRTSRIRGLSILALQLKFPETLAMTVSPLVAAKWLADHLSDPSFLIVDIRSTESGGQEAFAAGHIPGAIHSDYAVDGWRIAEGGTGGLLPSANHLPPC